MQRFMFLPVVLLATLGSPAAGQTLAEACERVADITVGQWAEYRATDPEMGNQPIGMRFAIVGTEAVGGTEHYWVELQMSAPQGRMIMQMLVPSWPYESSQIKGLIMKSGDEPAMRMPQQTVDMMMQQTGGGGEFTQDVFENCDAAELIGNETVTVPAGTVETMHMRSTEGDGGEAWVALDIPFGLVKMQGPNGESLELVGHGMDAESAITETPQEPGG